MRRISSIILMCLLQILTVAASTFSLTVEVTPEGAATPNTRGGTYEEGEEIYLRISGHTGFIFKGWYTGEDLVSSATNFRYSMPSQDVTIQARFEYDPAVPANPAMPDTTTYYTLTAVPSPAGAASLNLYEGRYAAGASVSLRASGRTGYIFDGWQNDNGERLSSSASFSLKMPAHDTHLTALYHYDPAAPANPDQMGTNYTTVLKSRPAGGGSFNTSSVTTEEGNNARVYAYTNTGFRFLRWEDENGNTLSSNREFNYVMPHGGGTLYCIFDYDPEPPSNPLKNYWNKEFGEAIIDDFTPGDLSRALSSAITGSDRSDVTMITVAGVMTSNDFGIANNYPSCTLLDLSRVTGIAEIPSYAFDNTNLETVILPATIEKIGTRAFENCKQLAAVTIYAMTPPALESNVFRGIPEGLVIYVPAATVAQYQDADVWKEFTILPIQEDVRNLTVSLPAAVSPESFARMWLEIRNTKNGQRLHYVMTDRQAYTFANIIRNTTWDVTLRNERGDIFGHIENVEVKDEDVSVELKSLSLPQTVTLTVLTPDGEDVSDMIQIGWTDAAGNYLGQSALLSGLRAGLEVNYTLTLPQNLAMKYLIPTTTSYTIAESGNKIEQSLSPIPQLKLAGKINDSVTGLPLNGSIVTASQTFGGKYNQTVSGKTDRNGEYTLTVFKVPTSLTASATDYVSQTLLCDSLMTDKESVGLPQMMLKPISGAVIAIGFTYQKSCADGEEPESEDWYSNYSNVSYSIFNKTTNRPVTQFNVQYPSIVLLEEVSENDVLEITTTSLSGEFMPVMATAVIDDAQKGDAIFDIIELGGLRATFVKNGNPSVSGSLYDANGKLYKTYAYDNSAMSVNGLKDGTYTLITMGDSRLFNNIYSLDQLPQTGLSEGTDYVSSKVEIESGLITEVNIESVPTLNEAKLYYTGDNTSFTVNKPSIVAGNYLTLTGRIDFKPAYISDISNLRLIVDLPKECDFVENSVMVGNATASYTLDGERLTIPLTRVTDRVRFCVIPTLGGEYAPSAFARFDLNGETITQPIGAANYTAKDLSLSAPSIVAKTSIPVSGTAAGKSTVEIYDGDVMIGQTQSLANGTWATTCELIEPYNLSKHEIYAKVTTKEGLNLRSETIECTYDINAIRVSKVTMYHDNPEMHKTYEINFDFIDPKNEDQFYIYYIYNKIFSFIIDFTTNDYSRISDVVLIVKTGNGNEIPLDASFDENINLWVASGEFGNMYDGDIPVNVSVDYYCDGKSFVDRALIDKNCSALENDVKANLTEKEIFKKESSLDENIDQAFIILNNILDDEEFSTEALNTAIDSLSSYHNPDVIIDYVDNENIEQLKQDFEKLYSEWKDGYYLERDSIVDLLYDNIDFTYRYEYSFEDSGRTIRYSYNEVSKEEVNHLDKEAYQTYELTDSSSVYYKYTENSMEFIDASTCRRFFIESDGEIQIAEKTRTTTGDLIHGVNSCVQGIASTIKIIKTGWDNGSLGVKEVTESLQTLFGFVHCYYTSVIASVRSKYVTELDNLIANYNLKIKNAEELKELSWQRVISFRDKITTNNKLQSEIDHLLAEKQELLLNGNLSKEEFKNISNECANLRDQSKIYKSESEAYKQALKRENSEFARHQNQASNLAKGKDNIVKAKSKLNNVMAKLPSKITAGGKTAKIISVSGKLAGFFGTILQIWSLGVDIADAQQELHEWVSLQNAIDRKMPCERDHDNALRLQYNIHNDAKKVTGHYIGILSSEIASLGFSLADGIPIYSPTWWASSLCTIYAEWTKYLAIEKYVYQRGEYWLDINYLQCTGKEPKDPRTNNGDKRKRHEESNNKDTGKGIDPSGFVYEAVASNRVEGVVATIFYKEMVEDMYGDLHENIVKWDAAEYAQENPLFTDEEGNYRWDVPQGLWQVRFEKEGYETTFSEWLPVPPPQLEVNIPIRQNVQPNVKLARAFEDAVEVEFDKYMQPETLSADNIVVLAEDKPIAGTLLLLNEEEATEESGETFASKVRFNAAEPFSTKEVTLLVKNRVKSYADVRMQDDYIQSFGVELEIRKIECDSVVEVAYGGSHAMKVIVAPAAAAAGKTLNVSVASAMTISTDTQSAVLDKDGSAEIVINGDLPGSGALRFSVEGYDLSEYTIVNVRKDFNKVATPKISIASGSTVDKGTEVYLTCDTEGATIVYTLDGSCPCDDTDARKEYDGNPIVIDQDVTIKAIAYAPDIYESEIATFNYYVADTGVDGVLLDDRVKLYPLPMREELTISAGDYLIKKIAFTNLSGVSTVMEIEPARTTTVDVSRFPTGIYLITIETEMGETVRKVMKVN